MSYILEALKKSEQERQQGNVPGLQTLTPQLLESTQSSRWPYVVIGVLALSLVFVLGWMRPWSAPQNLTNVVTTTPRADVKTPMPVERVAAVSVAVNEPAAVKHQTRSTQSAEPVEPSLFLQSVPHLQDMPSLMQQAIPDLEFAGHVYTRNSEQRSVIINNRSMAEGDIVVAGLKVEQITKQGVVFSYQGQLFHMPVLQDWAFD